MTSAAQPATSVPGPTQAGSAGARRRELPDSEVRDGEGAAWVADVPGPAGDERAVGEDGQPAHVVEAQARQLQLAALPEGGVGPPVREVACHHAAGRLGVAAARDQHPPVVSTAMAVA